MKSCILTSVVSWLLVPNLGILLLLVRPDDLCHAQEPRVVSANEQRVIEQGRKRAANLMLIEDRVAADRRGCFYIDEYFREQDAGFAVIMLRKDNKLWELFLEESVRKEIQLGPEQSKDFFKTNQQWLEPIKSVTLPVQLKPVSNFAKLHSVFTLGPIFVFEQVAGDKFPPGAEFGEKLEAMKLRVSKIIEKNTLQIANRYVRLVDEKGDLNSTFLKLESIVNPDRTTYEQLVSPLLMLEKYEIGN